MPGGDQNKLSRSAIRGSRLDSLSLRPEPEDWEWYDSLLFAFERGEMLVKLLMFVRRAFIAAVISRTCASSRPIADNSVCEGRDESSAASLSSSLRTVSTTGGVNGKGSDWLTLCQNSSSESALRMSAGSSSSGSVLSAVDTFAKWNFGFAECCEFREQMEEFALGVSRARSHFRTFRVRGFGMDGAIDGGSRLG